MEFPVRRFPPLSAMYGWSNVYRIMLTYEQAERYRADGLTANCLCPGFVPVVRAGATAFQNLMIRVIPRFMPNSRTPEQAAETVVYLASSPEAAQLNEIQQVGVDIKSHPTDGTKLFLTFLYPTLRNIELTPPYMHDGRFATIDAVIAHYKSGVKSSPTKDPLLHKLDVEDHHIQALKAFIDTFTDTLFYKNPEFKNPFK